MGHPPNTPDPGPRRLRPNGRRSCRCPDPKPPPSRKRLVFKTLPRVILGFRLPDRKRLRVDRKPARISAPELCSRPIDPSSVRGIRRDAPRAERVPARPPTPLRGGGAQEFPRLRPVVGAVGDRTQPSRRRSARCALRPPRTSETLDTERAGSGGWSSERSSPPPLRARCSARAPIRFPSSHCDEGRGARSARRELGGRLVHVRRGHHRASSPTSGRKRGSACSTRRS